MAAAPPIHNLDAEAAVLSGTFLVPDRFPEILPILPMPECFYADANRFVWQAKMELSAKGSPIDVVTVAQHLQTMGKLEAVGGTPYLARIQDSTPSYVNIVEHARIVQTAYRQRQAIVTLHAATAELRDGTAYTPEALEEILTKAETELLAIAHFGSTRSIVIIREAISEAYAQIQAAIARGSSIQGATTGFNLLDRMIGGLERGNLYVVAARPGMGKTALVLSILMNTAKVRNGAALFSAEMPTEQIMMRMLASEARVDFMKLKDPIQLQRQEHVDLADAVATLAPLPIWIDDGAAPSVADIRAAIRKLKSQIAVQAGKPGAICDELLVVAVDYMQLCKALEGDNREQQVSSISRGLKQIAKEERIAVIALSQLNRGAESRPNKRPILSDLRETGAIEQDADAVLFLYRDEYYNRDDVGARGTAEVDVAKQRNGPTGVRRLRFGSFCMRFDNLADEEYGDYAPGL